MVKFVMDSTFIFLLDVTAYFTSLDHFFNVTAVCQFVINYYLQKYFCHWITADDAAIFSY
jgi:hypothetical protein